MAIGGYPRAREGLDPGIAVFCSALALTACRDDDTAGRDDTTVGTGTTDAPLDTSADPSSSDDGSTGDVPTACDGAPSTAMQPMRRLNREQIANAVEALLGVSLDVAELDGDEQVGAFASNLTAPLSTNGVHQLRIAAELAAASGLADLVDGLSCDPTIDSDCMDEWIASFGRRVYRRTLTGEEAARHRALADLGVDPIDGMRLVVTAMLQSPYFLYAVEPVPEGEETVALSGPPLATRMALFLWSSTPDDTLLDAAESDGLSTIDDVRAQAERMLADPRARASVGSFHTQWLAVNGLLENSKSPEIYPEFDGALATAMLDETRRFAEAVVLHGDGRLATLLTADWSYAEPQLAALYGVTPAGPGEPTTLDATERSGLLTHASFLARHAHADQSGPVQRGVVVLSNMFCNPPMPAPVNANTQPPSLDPDATTRERFSQHTEDPACAGCHSVIDGIGLGFEHYDGIGRHRQTENGLAVDASGELLGTDVDGSFDGVIELSQRMADSTQVRQCTARQWMRFAIGRPEADADACTVERLVDAFEDSDGDVRGLMLEIVTSDAFRLQAPESP